VLVSLFAEELAVNLFEAFVATLREISVPLPTELFWTFLLFPAATDLPEVSLPCFTEEPETVLLVTLVAEARSTPGRLLSIDLFALY